MITPENPDSGMQPKGSQMPEPERRVERLLGLLIAGLMLLNFPLLSIFSVSDLFLGIPTLYFYLFFVWFLIIGITAFVLQGRATAEETPTENQDLREP